MFDKLSWLINLPRETSRRERAGQRGNLDASSSGKEEFSLYDTFSIWLVALASTRSIVRREQFMLDSGFAHRFHRNFLAFASAASVKAALWSYRHTICVPSTANHCQWPIHQLQLDLRMLRRARVSFGSSNNVVCLVCRLIGVSVYVLPSISPTDGWRARARERKQEASRWSQDLVIICSDFMLSIWPRCTHFARGSETRTKVSFFWHKSRQKSSFRAAASCKMSCCDVCCRWIYCVYLGVMINSPDTRPDQSVSRFAFFAFRCSPNVCQNSRAQEEARWSWHVCFDGDSDGGVEMPSQALTVTGADKPRTCLDFLREIRDCSTNIDVRSSRIDFLCARFLGMFQGFPLNSDAIYEAEESAQWIFARFGIVWSFNLFSTLQCHDH